MTIICHFEFFCIALVLPWAIPLRTVKCWQHHGAIGLSFFPPSCYASLKRDCLLLNRPSYPWNCTVIRPKPRENSSRPQDLVASPRGHLLVGVDPPTWPDMTSQTATGSGSGSRGTSAIEWGWAKMERRKKSWSFTQPARRRPGTWITQKLLITAKLQTTGTWRPYWTPLIFKNSVFSGAKSLSWWNMERSACY